MIPLYLLSISQVLYFLYIIYIVLLKIVRHVRQNSCIPTESKADPCLTDFTFTRQAFCDPLLRVSQKSVSQLSYSSETKTYIPLIAYILSVLYILFYFGINQRNTLYFVIFVKKMHEKLCYKLLQCL